MLHMVTGVIIDFLYPAKERWDPVVLVLRCGIYVVKATLYSCIQPKIRVIEPVSLSRGIGCRPGVCDLP